MWEWMLDHIPQPGDMCCRIEDAVAAPGGFRAWMPDVLAAVPRESSNSLRPLFDPFDTLSEMEAALDRNADRAPFSNPLPVRPWSERLAWTRYRFLASFGAPQVPAVLGPDQASHERRRAWVDWQRAEADLERARLRYHAALAAELGESVPSARRGRPPDTAKREVIRALLDLFVEMFGAEPTTTRNGPAVRFVQAALRCGPGEWWRTPVPDDADEPGRRLLFLGRRLCRPVCPNAEAIRDFVRQLRNARPPRWPPHDFERARFATDWFECTRTDGGEMRPKPAPTPAFYRIARGAAV